MLCRKSSPLHPVGSRFSWPDCAGLGGFLLIGEQKFAGVPPELLEEVFELNFLTSRNSTAASELLISTPFASRKSRTV